MLGTPPIFAPGQRVTCIGYSATGQPCRRAVARGPSPKYCHLHVHQGITFADSLAVAGGDGGTNVKVDAILTAGRGHRQGGADDSDSEEADGKPAVIPPRGYSKAYLPKDHSNPTKDKENETIVVSSSEDDDDGELAELAIRVRKLAISNIQTTRKRKSDARTEGSNQPHVQARMVVPSPLSGARGGTPSRKRVPDGGLNQPPAGAGAPPSKPRSSTVSASPTPRKDSLVRRTKTADPLRTKPPTISPPRVPSTPRAGPYVVAPARTASASASISLPAGSYQCTARTRRTGERCTRIVRKGGAGADERGSGSGESGEGEGAGVLCHQHRAEQLDEALNEEELAVDLEAPRAMGDPGGDAEAFLSSFGTSLPAQTAHLLRTELLRPVSAADEGGYLYAYRIYSESPPTISSSSSSPSPSSTPSSSPPTHLLKIGRSLHPHRYLTQWSHHCNHPLTLIAVFPHSPGHITTPHPGLQCRLAHRAERLVHIHLGGAHPVRAGAGAGKCAGCGEVRREWFEGEWDEVRRAVEGWVGFVGVVRTGSGGGPKGGMVAGAGEDVGEAAMDVKLRNGSLIVPGTTSDLPGDHESIEGSVAPAVGSPRDLTLVDGSRPATLPPTGAPLAHKSTNGRAFEVPAPATDLKPIEGPPSATRTPLPPPRKRKYHVSTKRKPDPAVESDEDETWFTATED